jgi:hypothetical protein
MRPREFPDDTPMESVVVPSLDQITEITFSSWKHLLQPSPFLLQFGYAQMRLIGILMKRMDKKIH